MDTKVHTRVQGISGYHSQITDLVRSMHQDGYQVAVLAANTRHQDTIFSVYGGITVDQSGQSQLEIIFKALVTGSLASAENKYGGDVEEKSSTHVRHSHVSEEESADSALTSGKPDKRSAEISAYQSEGTNNTSPGKQNSSKTDIDKTDSNKTDIDKTGIDKTDIDKTDIDKKDIDKTGIDKTDIDKTKSLLHLKCWSRGCTFRTSYAELLDDHLEKVHDLRHKCPLCPFRAMSLNSLKQHQKRSHNSVGEDSPSTHRSPISVSGMSHIQNGPSDNDAREDEENSHKESPLDKLKLKSKLSNNKSAKIVIDNLIKGLTPKTSPKRPHWSANATEASLALPQKSEERPRKRKTPIRKRERDASPVFSKASSQTKSHNKISDCGQGSEMTADAVADTSNALVMLDRDSDNALRRYVNSRSTSLPRPTVDNYKPGGQTTSSIKSEPFEQDVPNDIIVTVDQTADTNTVGADNSSDTQPLIYLVPVQTTQQVYAPIVTEDYREATKFRCKLCDYGTNYRRSFSRHIHSHDDAYTKWPNTGK